MDEHEIVFTYRQAEQVEPVQLRYERPLPERMCRRKPSYPFRDEKDWRQEIAPLERKRKGRWSVRLFVGTCLLTALVCLGVGIWYVGQYGWILPSERQEEIPPEDREPGEEYYWDLEISETETTISRYPTGGETRLSLTAPAEELPLSPGAVYDQVNPAVVTVVGRRSGFVSVGTGIIFSSDGYILTNHHVIAGCSSCDVWSTGEYGERRTFQAKLVGSDEAQDLAVLKIEGNELPTAEFGVSDDLEVGDPVYAIGNPLGTELLNTFTNGVVSAVNRSVDVDGVQMTLIQTNAALNNGNSGGPLINQYGQVVGINTIKMMSERDTIEGLGFAIPSSLAVRWVNELIEYGELLPQPVLGITTQLVPKVLPDDSVAVVRVHSVTPGLSGAMAGLRVGDYVVAFNGQEITNTSQLLEIRRGLFVGDEVPIRVFRNGEYLELMMVMMAE